MNKVKLLAIICMILVALSMNVNASAGSVTGYQKITWGISTGRYYVNDKHAFCAQYNKSWPTVGTVVKEIIPSTNEVLRKALYYGYNGPQNTLGTDERAHVLTAIAVSDANIGERETGASAKYDAFYWELVNNPNKYPTPPNNFKVYLAITVSDEMQNLAFYEVEKIKIDILLKKVDAETLASIPQGQAKLEGAQFTVQFYEGTWADNVEAVPQKTWVFQTDANGIVKYEKNYLLSGDELYESMPIGTMVIKETKPSEGYLVNEEVYVKQITQNGEYNPPVIPEKTVEIRVTKYQSNTEEVIPGTVFEHITPDGRKTKVITDENGKFVLKGLEYGVHRLKEISVMDGYIIEEQEKSFVIDENVQNHLEIAVYNKVAPYELLIHKTDDYGNKLYGAEFSIYEDLECKTEIKSGVTDENGILCIQGLEVGQKYFLKETKAPPGYLNRKDLDGEEHVYELYALSTPVKEEFACFVDGKTIEKITGTKANREVHLEIKNDVEYVLPKTGTSTVLCMNIAGIALCGMSLYMYQKTNREKRRENL